MKSPCNSPSLSKIYRLLLNPIFHFFMAQQPLVGEGLLIIEASRSHSDTPHSTGLLWTTDQSYVETSTWQHTTHKRHRHACLRRDSNPQSQQANGRRATPRTARPLGSADISLAPIKATTTKYSPEADQPTFTYWLFKASFSSGFTTKMCTCIVCPLRALCHAKFTSRVHHLACICLKVRNMSLCRSRWPWGPRRATMAARLPGLWVRIPLKAWMFLWFLCAVEVAASVTGRPLVQGSPAECVCLIKRDLETLTMRWPRPALTVSYHSHRGLVRTLLDTTWRIQRTETCSSGRRSDSRTEQWPEVTA